MAKKKKMSYDEMLHNALNIKDSPYVLPDNWLWVKTEATVKWSSGGTPKSTNKEYYNGTIPWTIIADLNYSYFSSTEKKITELGLKDSSAKLVEPYSILIGMYGSIGKLGINTVKCATNQAIAFTKEIYSCTSYKYVFYYFMSAQERLFNLGRGGAQQNINQHILKDFPFPLPPIEEQERIVPKIENMFSKLDGAKNLVKEILEEYDNRRSSILHKAFNGEMTSKWRIINEDKLHDSINLEKILSHYNDKKTYNSISKHQKKKYINSNGWLNGSIGAIGKVKNGSTPSRAKNEYWNGDIHWVSSGEVKNCNITDTKQKISKLGYDNSSVELMPKGTVLIAMIGEGKTRGQTAILNIPATTNQNVAAIDLSHNEVLSKYVWYWLMYKYNLNREIGSGNGPKALNCTKVRELEFLVPPLLEQHEIVKILDNILEKELEYRSQLEEIIDYIEMMKKSILARAFRGKLGTNNGEDGTGLKLLKEIIKSRCS